MTSERGLCGGFNTNIVKRARNEIRRLVNEGKTVKVTGTADVAAKTVTVASVSAA